jgi:hypothetical protein
MDDSSLVLTNGDEHKLIEKLLKGHSYGKTATIQDSHGCSDGLLPGRDSVCR